jgi:two-component system sensor histidine kinase HydH
MVIADQADRIEARRLANRKVAFYGHAVVFACTGLFFLVVTGTFVTAIVMLSWGIGLAAHGFFAVAAPLLHRRWTREIQVRLASNASEERQKQEGRHARSLEVLSASIAHEIRNPITAARSLVAQIGEDPSAAENVEYARVALEELDRVERSISHLLRFARDQEITPQDVSLQDVLESSLETFRARLDKSRVVLIRHFETEGSVRADPEKMRRVLVNLVGNALDALEAGASSDPRLDVSMGENLAGTEVWLRLRDNGPGIPADRIGKVFTPFSSSKTNGTGLGLALSKRIVESHGGTLEVKSEPGNGAELTLVLPKRGAEGR